PEIPPEKLERFDLVPQKPPKDFPPIPSCSPFAPHRSSRVAPSGPLGERTSQGRPIGRAGRTVLPPPPKTQSTQAFPRWHGDCRIGKTLRVSPAKPGVSIGE